MASTGRTIFFIISMPQILVAKRMWDGVMELLQNVVSVSKHPEQPLLEDLFHKVFGERPMDYLGTQ